MNAQTPSVRRPAPLALAIVAELVAALVGGVLIAIVLGYGIGLLLSFTPMAEQLGMGLLAVMLYVGLAGLALGAAGATTLVGRLLRQGGSFWLALSGAVTGLILAVVLVVVLNNGTDAGQMPLVGLAVLVFAVVAYNLRRRAL